MTRRDGFTLIELLLVLAIIGIISAVAIPALLGFRAVSRTLRIHALAELERLSHELEVHDAWRLNSRVEELLQQVGLAEKSDRRPRDLTQIEMRKLELARAMAAAPKLLIADEAMAGLSNAEVDDILALLVKLSEQGITVVLIEHIMRAVMSFSQRLVVLVAGRKMADGKPQDVMRNPEVVRAYLGE